MKKVKIFKSLSKKQPKETGRYVVSVTDKIDTTIETLTWHFSGDELICKLDKGYLFRVLLKLENLLKTVITLQYGFGGNTLIKWYF